MAAHPPQSRRRSAHGLRILCFEDLHVGMRETLMKIGDGDRRGRLRHMCPATTTRSICATPTPPGTRFGQRIAHGLYTASLISAVLGTRLPGPGAVYRSQTLNFHAPVKIGDVVTVIVEVIELVPQGRKVRLALRGAGRRHAWCSTARRSSRCRRRASLTAGGLTSQRPRTDTVAAAMSTFRVLMTALSDSPDAICRGPRRRDPTAATARSTAPWWRSAISTACTAAIAPSSILRMTRAAAARPAVGGADASSRIRAAISTRTRRCSG